MRSSRIEAIRFAREKQGLQPVYLDTETTGISQTSEIVEISIIDHEGHTLLDSLVKPTRPIPPDAYQIHHISNEMVQSAPSWPEVWAEANRLLSGKTVGVYNADFDLRLIKQTHARHMMVWKPRDFQFFCIMKLYAQFVGEWNARQRDYRWHSLDAAGRQCRIQLSNTHRALDDTRLARAVFEHIAAQSS